MVEGVKEMNKSISVSIGALIFGAATIIVTTFSLTTIYNQFLLQDELIRDTHNAIDRVEGRLDKKTKRNEDALKELEDRITTLELPSSDSPADE